MFAHTVDNYGPECIWWVHCSCFGCRDHFDPEGVRDAWARTKNPDVVSFIQLTEAEREGAPEVKERNVDHLLDMIFGAEQQAEPVLKGPGPLELPTDFPQRTKSHYPGTCGDACQYGCASYVGLSNEAPADAEFVAKLDQVRRDISGLIALAKEPGAAGVLTNVQSLLNIL